MELGSILTLLRRVNELAGKAKSVLERNALLPSTEEKMALKKLLDQIQSRRVFHAPFNVEVVSSCVGSVDEIRRLAYETLGALKAEPARIFTEALLDDVRIFIDHWRASPLYHGVHGWHRDRWGVDHHRGQREDSLADFYESLGALRLKVSQYEEGFRAMIDDGLL